MDPRGGPGRFDGPSGRSGTVHWTLWEVRDGSLDHLGGLGRVEGPSGRNESGRETLEEDRNGTWRSGTAQRTLGEIRGRFGFLGAVLVWWGDPRGGQGQVGDPWGGPEWVRGPSGRSGMCKGPSGKTETGRETLGKHQNRTCRSGTAFRTLGEVRDGSEDPWGGTGQLGGTSGRSQTGWGSIGQVQNGSKDPRGIPGRVGGP